jgi:SOS response regulatory protein OraA/RecX
MPVERRKTGPTKVKTKSEESLLTVPAPAEDSTFGHGAASALDILRRRQQSRDELKLQLQERPLRK